MTVYARRGLLALALVLLRGSVTTHARAASPPGGSLSVNTFVTKSGHQLMLNGQPFYFLGANAYWLIDAALNDASAIDDFFKHCNTYGLKVIRTWAFNHKLPVGAGVYDEIQFQALDYVINSARQHNVRLILALGNTWEAYRSPEDFMRMAGVDPTKRDILEGFYGDASVRSLYRNHMYHVVSHVNSLNGVQYLNDPTIMMWDVINEPRCPGCTSPGQQAVVEGWLHEMSDSLRGWVGPRQLVAAGTEGYFMNTNVDMNPGYGTQCEGEDWDSISQLPSIDVSTAHIYKRQMEYLRTYEGGPFIPCDFECYCNFFVEYTKLHETLSSQYGKPLVIEEFNVILPDVTEDQRTAFFKLAYSLLLAAQKRGSSMMGMMFWSAAQGHSWDDGYNIYIDELPASSRGPAQKDARKLLQSASATTTARAPITANTEGLDWFRRGNRRAQCSQLHVEEWVARWNSTEYRTLDIDQVMGATSGMTVNQVILNAATQLNS